MYTLTLSIKYSATPLEGDNMKEWVRFQWTVSSRIPSNKPPPSINPFTPESDQCQNSPVASQEIWHHTVWRTWLRIAYSNERWLYYKLSLHHSYNCFLKGWKNTLFELRSERVKRPSPKKYADITCDYSELRHGPFVLQLHFFDKR